jgi:hypothetical protein
LTVFPGTAHSTTTQYLKEKDGIGDIVNIHVEVYASEWGASSTSFARLSMRPGGKI